MSILVDGSKFILFFLQFNISIPDVETKIIHRIIGYGNPSLLRTLVGSLQVYIDSNSNIVARSCYQFLIAFVCDVQTGFYIPVMYVLMTGKSESLYWYTLH